MKHAVIKIIKEKRYTILLLLWLFELLPFLNLLLTFGREESGSHYIKILFFITAFVFSIFLLLLSCSVFLQRLTLVLLTLSVLPIATIKIGFFDIYKTTVIPKTNWYDVFATTRAESKDFISLNANALLPVILYALFVGVFLYKSLRETSRPVYRKMILLSMPLVVLSFYCETVYSGKNYEAYYYLNDFHAENSWFESALIERRRHMGKFRYTAEQNGSSPAKIVIIIGESLASSNMSLYKYKRATNPKLGIRKDLCVFENVVTPFSGTASALNYILTFGSHQNPQLVYSAPGISEIFKSAGYTTKWISNQGMKSDLAYYPGAMSLYMQIAYDCDTVIEKYRMQGSFDESLLSPFSLEFAKIEKQIIFIHLGGNHLSYEKRFPLHFKKWLSYEGRRKEMIENYDNSILYNDYIIDSILSITARDKNNLTLYFSDHGEVTGQCPDRYIGHNSNYPNIYTVRVPLIFQKNTWFDSTRSRIFETNRNKLFSTEDLIHTVMDVAGIRGPFFQSEKSIFSPAYKEIRRKVGDHVYYDQLLLHPCGN